MARHLETAPVEFPQRFLSLHHVQGGALLVSALGEQQRAVREVECGESVALWNRAIGTAPAQSSRNHQVHDQKEPPFQAEHDALAHAPYLSNSPALYHLD